MPRVKLVLPRHFPFETELTLRVTDMNYGNHLGNDATLGLIHEARLSFYAEIGYREDDIEGLSTLMTQSIINYKGVGLRGDRIRIGVGVSELKRSRFELVYGLFKADGAEEIARATTEIVFFDYAKQGMAIAPEPFVEKMQKFAVALE